MCCPQVSLPTEVTYGVQLCHCFEVADVSSQAFQVVPLGVSTDHIVCPVRLIGCDEIWIVDRWAWLHEHHVWCQLLLQANLQHFGTFHCIGQVQR